MDLAQLVERIICDVKEIPWLDDEGFSVDSLLTDLEMELLELITKSAWDDAERT